MAKLIKRPDAAAPTEAAPPQETQVAADVPQRRGAVIDRGTFEAKHEAVSIRDRAEAQAQEILDAARAQADEVVAQAHKDAEALRAQAHEAGLAEGRAEGGVAYVALCAQVREQAEASQAALAPHVSQLAMAIARRVLGRELEFAPERIVEMVKKTLGDKARQRRDITLRLHPSDAVHLRERRAELAEVLSRGKDLRFVEDEAVRPHGVIIETEAGIIDAQLETQLAAIEQALEAVR